MEAKLVWNPIECVLLGCWAGNGYCEMNTRRGWRAAVGMGGRTNNRDEGEASWEDVQSAGGSEAVEQRDGLTPCGFQGTCSVWFRLRTDTLQWRCESTPAIQHQTHRENREQVCTCMWMCVCVWLPPPPPVYTRVQGVTECWQSYPSLKFLGGGGRWATNPM